MSYTVHFQNSLKKKTVSNFALKYTITKVQKN